jgi:hypothetical protein
VDCPQERLRRSQCYTRTVGVTGSVDPTGRCAEDSCMILTAIQSVLTANLALIAIVKGVGMFAVALLVLFLVRRHFRTRTQIVYFLREHDLRITFARLDQDEPEVVVVLGSETRTFELEGFIKFWSDMVDVGRKAIDAHLELTRSVDSAGKDRAATIYFLERNDLRITFTRLNHKKVEVILALGTEARTIRFKEFIDFWLDMTKLAPYVADRHIAYSEARLRQDAER